MQSRQVLLQTRPLDALFLPTSKLKHPGGFASLCLTFNDTEDTQR